MSDGKVTLSGMVEAVQAMRHIMQDEYVIVLHPKTLAKMRNDNCMGVFESEQGELNEIEIDGVRIIADDCVPEGKRYAIPKAAMDVFMGMMG